MTTDRNATIYWAVLGGETFKQVAGRMGLSVTRVRQVFYRHQASRRLDAARREYARLAQEVGWALARSVRKTDEMLEARRCTMES